MANITKTDDNKCYSCGKQCVNIEFCGEGASYDVLEDNGINLSKNLRVKIIANPDFWGFSGVLISGWATFSNGYYDFFDGYDQDHSAYKSCGATTIGPLLNESRPDVLYRSVYIPDSGVRSYGADGLYEGKNRGGAEAYLVDRPKGLITSVSSDSSSCDTSNPATVFKKFPENFGWANKIHFKNEVYKNITGAWRLSSLENCYPESAIHRPSGLLLQCDGTEKQNIVYKDRKFEKYDKFITRSSGDNCIQDGGVAGEYAGSFGPSGIFRDLSQSPFLQAHISYNNSAASGIRNGTSLYIENDVNASLDGIYTVFDVSHSGSFTSVKFVGTHEGSYSQTLIGPSGQWVSLNSFDENTCCSNAAYGVGSNKIIEQNNFHTDFRRIFNNPKNIRQSNRDIENRVNYGYSIVPSGSGYRKDVTYPSIDNSGNVIISGGFPFFERELPYYGSFITTDVVDSGIRSDDKINRMVGRNGTCYSKHATLEIFPDCITQYTSYTECETEASKFQINRVPRLAFVYRGCDFNDNCQFDSSGRPLAGWENGSPTGIEDLKRGLGGQEIHMFINLSDAWAGKTQTCPCDCSAEPPPGQQPPDHITVRSPISYPSFPNFDLEPSGYGCLDPHHQLSKYREYIGTPDPAELCDPIHTLSQCCNVRQPYTTYGYIMNLCGKETQDRKLVISEAFAKYTQEKTYTNNSTNVSINEPMYWEVECPYPSGTSTWSTGVTGTDRIINVPGSGYGYWGLADENGLLVLPYYRGKPGYTDCCTVSANPAFVDFDSSGTFFNGWPTSSVPFLIEIEVDDVCGGCATANMPSTSLSMQIESMDTKYIHGFGLSTNDAYGFNHCRYSDDYVVSIGPPNFDCTNGFDEDYCYSGDALHRDYGERYTGGTCTCINGTEFALSPVYVSGTDIIKGFISNSITNPIVEISGCNKTKSGYLDPPTAMDDIDTTAEGFRIFGKFTLACNGMQRFLADPLYPLDLMAPSADPLDVLWNNSTGCSIHKPARVGQDLILTSKLWAVATEYVDLFKKIPESVLEQPSYSSGVLAEPISVASFSGAGNIFGLCPGDTLYTYGCHVSGDFYGCHNPCPTGNLCTTCETGYGSGQVICTDCLSQIGYNGIIPNYVPERFDLNSCGCLCSEPTLIAEYEIQNDWSWSLSSGDAADAACASVYWMGANGNNGIHIEPTLVVSQKILGVYLGTYTAEDWFKFSHGVNSQVSGVTHRLTAPIQDTDCGGLSIKSCTSTCSADGMVGAGSCGTPIYATGDPSVTINKTKCHPEIAIVTKIDCESSGYKLTLSREYYEHDRTWNEKIINDSDVEVCVPVYAGAYRHGSSCEILDYANPADSVTPAYMSPCSINPPSGRVVSQDFTFTNKPSSSGDTVWNYYNLFYQGTFPTSQMGISGQYVPSLVRDTNGDFDCASTGVDPNITAIFGTGNFLSPSGYWGTLSTNRKHSCVQDYSQCGGDIWCNKLFFPRHNYNAGTRIAPFGAPSICLSTNQFKEAYGLYGYEDVSTNEIVAEKSLLYTDWCNSNLTTTAVYDIDIDDVEIYVNDYLPLMGISHPGWRYTQDVKSCTIVGSGCVDGSLPTHSNFTISAGAHVPKTFSSNKFDSMGYYLDKLSANESDNCLFNPFKILIDVECSTNNIRRKGVASDDPLLLTAYSQFPSEACRGFIADAQCSCLDTQCRFFGTEAGGTCKQMYTCTSGHLRTVEYLCSGTQTVCVDCVAGSYNVIEEPLQTANRFLVDPDMLSAISNVDGTFNACVSCPTGVRCAGGVTDLSDWRIGCDGVYYRINSIRYVHEWVCETNTYVGSTGYSDSYSSECDCEAAWASAYGLCNAKKRSPNDTCDLPVSQWEDVPVEYPYSGGANLWWKECGCETKPRFEEPCYSDSLVKITITEGI